MKKLLLVVSLLLCSKLGFAADAMDQVTLERVVKTMAQGSKGEKGVVDFNFEQVLMYLISDTTHNRMRIIAPITDANKLSQAQISAILEANFHQALDARYAVSKGVLFSTYIHPLAELTEAQIQSAVVQVANLALSFGTEYSSGVLSYNKEKSEG